MNTKNVVIGSLPALTLSAGAVVGIGMTADAATPQHTPTAAQTYSALHHFSKLPVSMQKAISADLRNVHKSQDGIATAKSSIAKDLRTHRSTTADRQALQRAERGLTASLKSFHADGARAASFMYPAKKASISSPASWSLHHFSKLSGHTQNTIRGDFRNIHLSQDGILRAKTSISADLRAHRHTTADRQALQRAEKGLTSALHALHVDATKAANNYAN